MPAAILALLAASGLVFDASFRGEERAGNDAGQQAAWTALSASLRARDGGPDGFLVLSLEPSAVMGRQDRFFGAGALDANLRLDPAIWLRLRQRGGYGTADLSPLSGFRGDAATGSPVQPPPGERFVAIQESTTTVALDAALDRRLQLQMAAGWTVSGGADAEARSVLPLTRGPSAHASLEWRATHLDRLRADLSATDTRYSNGRRASVAALTAGWRHALAPGTDLLVAAGPGFGRARQESGDEATSAYGVARAELHSRVTHELTIGAGAAVEPLGDALTGDLVERGSVRAEAVWTRQRLVSLAARLIGSVALTSGAGGPDSVERGDQFFQGEIAATFPIVSGAVAGVGARGALQNRPVLGQPERQWALFASLAVQLPEVR